MPSNKLPKEKIAKYKKFAERLALRAGKILLFHQGGATVVVNKGNMDFATSADLASEKYIISSISKKFPGHSFLSEEAGESEKKSPFRWVIDPLDGTKEFMRGLPLYNVSIALEYNDELIVSALYRPFEKTLYSAGLGLGAFKNGEPIRVKSAPSLDKSFVYCYLPCYSRNSDKYGVAFDKLKKIGKAAFRLRALSDENTALCWLAQGSIEAYLNLSDKPKWHDIATGILIAREAGAIIDTTSFPMVATAGRKIYNEILSELK